jgi:hypothetical protein
MIQQTLDEETFELRQQLLKKEEIIEEKDKVLMNKIEELNKLNDNHKRILYKRNKHNLLRGNCLYIIRNEEITNKFKFGITKDLNSRYSAYNTYNIQNFLYIVYTEDNKLIEDCIRRKYRSSLTRYNSEWISDIALNDIIHFIDEIIYLLEINAKKYTNLEDIMLKDNSNEENNNSKQDDIEKLSQSIEYEIETITEPEKVNNENSSEIIVKKEEKITELNKKCNKCLLIVSKASFNKDKSKADGLHTVCRLCEKETKKRYTLEKQEKMEQITEKQCQICNETKPISNFSKHIRPGRSQN